VRRLSIAFPKRGEPFRPNSDQTAWLLEHNFCRDRGNRLPEETITVAVLLLFIGPKGKLIRRRRMAKIRSTAPHNEAEHHLRRAVFSVENTVHRSNVKISSLPLQEKMANSALSGNRRGLQGSGAFRGCTDESGCITDGMGGGVTGVSENDIKHSGRREKCKRRESYVLIHLCKS
jgi:hypothetical protein